MLSQNLPLLLVHSIPKSFVRMRCFVRKDFCGSLAHNPNRIAVIGRNEFILSIKPDNFLDGRCELKIDLNMIKCGHWVHTNRVWV